MYNHDLRLRRAGDHLRHLEVESRRWLKSSPYRVYTELDTERRNKLIKIEVFRDPPDELGLIIGDCLHNMRSALDNLVYDLARANRSVPLSKSIARASQFPIFKDRTQFVDKGMNQIRGVAPIAKTIIRGLQPYHRGNKFAYHRLWMLRELSNSDKHRVLHPTLLMPQAVSTFVSERNVFDITWKLGPLENGDVIARYPYTDESETESDMNPYFTFGVGLRQDSPLPILPEDVLNTMSAASILRWVHNAITRQVTPPLRLFLRRQLQRSSTS